MDAEVARMHPCFGWRYSCAGWLMYCEYLFITGHRRPCPGGELCTVKEKKARLNGRDLTINGQTKCVVDWAEITGISKNTLYFWYTRYGREFAEKKVLEVWEGKKDGKG